MKQQHEEILYEHRRILTMLHPHGTLDAVILACFLRGLILNPTS